MENKDEDRLYMYPKSSCTCYNCTKEKYSFPRGNPSNLAVKSCDISPYFSCFDRRSINSNQQPIQSEEKNITFINPESYTKKYSKQFSIIDCKQKSGHCTETQYASWDPRTWSATRNQYLTFDRPPLDSTPKLKDIYNDDLKGYGKNYQSYKDINAGQIIYYTDKSREDAYYRPLFNETVKVGTIIYKDPMGAIKPEYPRSTQYTNPITDDNCNYGEYNLSYIKDTNMHREDILSSQMTKINQQRWMPRWANDK